MPRFFLKTEKFIDGMAYITEDDAWHIARSLRMAVGDTVTVCDDSGDVHTCSLDKITDSLVVARVLSTEKAVSEMPFPVTLYQALPKGDKMDLIVQKAVEEGASFILPFVSERCVSRPDQKALEKKLQRWQRIALEAAKQCGRGVIPKVLEPLNYSQMLERAKSEGLALFCYEDEDEKTIKQALQDTPAPSSVGIIVGSEGGFSKREAEAAKEKGLIPCTLGKRILRCESAPGFALACVSYEFEL